MTIEVHRPKILDTKVLLLTGAGASKPLGMPLMRDFYSLVSSRSDKAQTELLNDISLVHLKATGEVIPDLEALLALIDRYRGFYDILFGDEKFGYQVDEEWKRWAKMEVDGLLVTDTPYTTKHKPPDYLAQSYFRKGSLESLDTLLRNLMFEVYGKDLDGSKVDKLYSSLFKVLGRYFSQDFIPIFTTNYDVAFETYAGEGNVKLETGFELTHRGNLWRPSKFDKFEPTADMRNIVLFKLHGSLTWHRRGDDIVDTSLSMRDPTGYESVVIYPTQTKEYPDEEPFRTMYDFLKGCLRVAKLAIVVGYSFRDPGIRRIMIDALDLNPNLFFILVCGPNVERWKEFAQQNLRSCQIIPHYFDSPPSGGEYLDELDAALVELKS